MDSVWLFVPKLLMRARADTQVLAGANFSGYVNAYGQPYTQANLLLDSGSVRHVSSRDTHTTHPVSLPLPGMRGACYRLTR